MLNETKMIIPFQKNRFSLKLYSGFLKRHWDLTVWKGKLLGSYEKYDSIILLKLTPYFLEKVANWKRN